MFLKDKLTTSCFHDHYVGIIIEIVIAIGIILKLTAKVFSKYYNMALKC